MSIHSKNILTNWYLHNYVEWEKSPKSSDLLSNIYFICVCRRVIQFWVHWFLSCNSQGTWTRNMYANMPAHVHTHTHTHTHMHAHKHTEECTHVLKTRLSCQESNLMFPLLSGTDTLLRLQGSQLKYSHVLVALCRSHPPPPPPPGCYTYCNGIPPQNHCVAGE